MLRSFLHRTASGIARMAAPSGPAVPAAPSGPSPVARRSFDAASSGRRWQGSRTFGQINSEVSAAAAPMRGRSRHYCRNDAYLSNGVGALVCELIGTGIRAVSSHPDPATAKRLQNRFNAWSSYADADGVTDYYGLQATAVRAMVEDGECFIHLESDGRGEVPLQVRLIAADQVDLAHSVNLDGGGHIVGGVEFDSRGRRVAYHVNPRSDDLFATVAPAIRLPAVDVLHLFQPLAVGQVRGIPWTATVLARLKGVDELEDALLLRQQMSAIFAGFVVEPNGNSEPIFPTEYQDPMPTLEPGTIQELSPGQDLRFAQAGEASEGIPFIKAQLGAVAAGLGIPTFMLDGDLSQANYSSLRAGLVQFRRRIEMLQYSIVIHQLARPIWERWVTMAVLSGQVDAPDFEASRADYIAAEFYPPAQMWVDPAKDMAAEALAVASGFKSRRQVVAAQGYDIETLDAEIAADRAREAALGLAFPVPEPAPQPAPVPDPTADPDAEPTPDPSARPGRNTEAQSAAN